MKSRRPGNKLTIIGGGIIGAMEAYAAYQEAKQNGETIRITIYEKHPELKQSTTGNIVPSLTPDEILSVVPRGQELTAKLKLLFSEPGGIRVDDAKNVNDTEAADRFKMTVIDDSKDEQAHQKRTDTLLSLGRLSMQMWQEIYDQADDELKQIFEESNFNPCREPFDEATMKLHDGYRIDLIYGVPQAADKANSMKASYQTLGYSHCKLLTPQDVIKADPFLKDFCLKNSDFANNVWNNDAVALWRPGGCLDTQIFLPKFYEYLRKEMGTYTNNNGQTQNCFRLKLDREITEVLTRNKIYKKSKVTGLRFFHTDKIKENNKKYKADNYVFCPGEAVGTLQSLGFTEPAYAGFAGPSLMLNIPLSIDEQEAFKAFNHCMEVHQEGVVLAWQARIRNGELFIGVGGTKAFYGDQRPHVDQAFAKDRNLLQLNIINDVLPQFISKALGRDTTGVKLSEDDMEILEKRNIAKRWVGVRAVAFDGFPTLGQIYLGDRKVINARCTTHMGSGGVSFAPASVFTSRSIHNKKTDNLISRVITYSDTRRSPEMPHKHKPADAGLCL